MSDAQAIIDSMELTITHLVARLAELQGPILTAMIDADCSDAYLMYRLTAGARGRPGICWKHGAVNRHVDCQIGPDWQDYWSCDTPECDYRALEQLGETP